jgi:hypothetical protein
MHICICICISCRNTFVHLPDDEWYRRLRAETSAHWGQLYSSILRLAFEGARARVMGFAPPSAPQQSKPHSVTVARHLRAQAMAAKRAAGAGAGAGAEDKAPIAAPGDSEDLELSDTSDEDNSTPADEFTVFRRCTSCLTGDSVQELPFRALVLAKTAGRDIDIESVAAVDSFDAARSVFKKAVAHLNKALVRVRLVLGVCGEHSMPLLLHAPTVLSSLCCMHQEFFVLNGFVTDHVGLITSVSKNYKYVRRRISVCTCPASRGGCAQRVAADVADLFSLCS